MLGGSSDQNCGDAWTSLDLFARNSGSKSQNVWRPVRLRTAFRAGWALRDQGGVSYFNNQSN
jgi:hypothetical protein